MGRGFKRKGTVVARVWGGLGNQLFIYAAAKRLALANDAVLKLDIRSGFANDKFARRYGLKHFDINDPIASPWESYLNLFGNRRRKMARKAGRRLPISDRTYIKYKGPFEPRILNLKIKRRVYLQGYWQDERYFKDIENVIRDRLVITTAHDSENQKWARVISEANAVCLHARRKNYDHALPVGYYRQAIGMIEHQIEKPHFFCFSDDPEWVRNRISADGPLTIVEHNKGDKDYEDLWLMTHCRHFIIANSTFSWWGAWLCPNRNKFVIAPANWGYDTAVPTDWKTI